MLFYPAMNACFTWFWKKRAFALGIVAAGSGLGGIIFPIMVNRLIPQVGFGWTMRICAFFILFLGIIANLTVVSRLPPAKRPVKFRDFYSPFKEIPFALLSFGSFLTFFGLFQAFTFIVLAGEHYNVPPHMAEYLVPVLNAGSIFGRIVCGKLGDVVGRFTVFALSTVMVAVTILAIWLPTSGTAGAFTFAVFFGFSSGAVVSLAPTLVAMISDVRQIGVRQGVMFSLVAIATLTGSPIGGEIITANDGSYRMMMVFAGVLTSAGAVLYTLLRWKLGGLSLKDKV
jgi:MFS family permease